MANYCNINVSGTLPSSGLVYAEYSISDWTVRGRDIDVGLAAPTDKSYTQYKLWGYGDYTTEGDVSWQNIPASGTVGVTLDNETGVQTLSARFRDAGLNESSVLTASITFDFDEPSKSSSLSWINLTDENNTSIILRSVTDNIDLTFDKTKLDDLRYHDRDFSGISISNDIITVTSGSEIWKFVENDVDGYVPVKKTFATDAVPFVKVNIGDGTGFKTLTTYSGAIKSDVTGNYLNRIDNYSFDSPDATWETYFDNTYWEIVTNPAWPYAKGSWDGEKWVAELDTNLAPGWYYLCLVPASGTSWADGFRPTKIRTTISGGVAGQINLYEIYSTTDSQGNPTIVDVSDYASLDEETMSWTAGEDVAMFLMTSNGNAFSVTNNEFYYAASTKDLTFDVYKFSQYGFATISYLQFTSDSTNAGYIGTSIDIKVGVYDTNGEGVEDAPVTLSGSGDDIGDFNANPVYTNSDGVATFTLALDTLGTAVYDASCDDVHTIADQTTLCLATITGQRSKLEQETQVDRTLTYDDSVSNVNNSDVAETTSVSGSLENNLNVIRTLMKDIKGTGYWYSDLGGYFDPTDTDAGNTENKTLNLTNIKNATLDSQTIIIPVEVDNSGAGFSISTSASGFLYTTTIDYAKLTDRRGLPIYDSVTNSGTYHDEGGSDDVCVIDLIDLSTGTEFESGSGNLIYAKFHDGADFGGTGDGTDIYVRFYSNDTPYIWTGDDPSSIMMVFPLRRVLSEMSEYEWVRTDFINGFEGDTELIDDITNLWSFTGASDNQFDPTWTSVSGNYILSSDPSDLESAIDLLNTEIGDRTYTTVSGNHYLTNGEDITDSLDALSEGIIANDGDIATNASNISTNASDISTLQSSMSSLNIDISNLEAAIGSATISGLNYSSNVFVSDYTSIETAIGALDAGLIVSAPTKYVETINSDITMNVEHSLPNSITYTPYSTAGVEGKNMDVWLDGQLLMADSGVNGANADRDYGETSASGVTFRFTVYSGTNLTYVVRC